MQIEYTVTKITGQQYCYQLPTGTPYEVREDDTHITATVITEKPVRRRKGKKAE